MAVYKEYNEIVYIIKCIVKSDDVSVYKSSKK